jgi:glycine dehydrogenase subunit 1
MGEPGLRRVADISYRRAHELASRLAAVPGFAIKFPGRPFLWEFVLECPLGAEALASQLAERGILAGYPLGRTDPALASCLLVCATETSSAAAITRYEQAVAELVKESAQVGAPA